MITLTTKIFRAVFEVLKFEYGYKETENSGKKIEILYGLVYDLRPQGKAQRATLCSY
jgi:hypothetical protein